MMDVLDLLKKHGFEAAEIPMGDLVYNEESRAYCAANKCRSYGATWACPPAVGSLEKCRAECEGYSRFFLFARMYELEDSLDIEGMGDAHDDFQERVDALGEDLEPGKFLLLNNEGCTRCDECTYPDAPCRFPEKLYPSIEGYGFLVSALAKQAGIPYTGKPTELRYFGAVLV
jgi:predicted metal-binding protein